MQSMDFFLNKAEQYASSLDTIRRGYIDYFSARYDAETEAEFKTQKAQIEDLTLKVQLLFSEFDKGEAFYQRVKSAEEAAKADSSSSAQTEALATYVRTLQLFIEHIKEFRST
jgi:hypothetical protein